MAGNDNAGSIQACALRVTRLGGDGSSPAGANSMIVTDSLITLGVSVQKEDGEEFIVKNACGAIKHSYKDDDKFKRLDLSLNFTDPDVELLEMTTGGTLITSGGMSIGYALQAVGAGSGNGVCVEAWSKAWKGGGAPAPSVFTDFVTTSGSTTISSSSANFSSVDVGRTVTGSGIPNGATITTVTNQTTASISVAATATQTGQTLSISRPGRFWRHVFPMWKGNLDDFELSNSAKETGITGPSYENAAIGNGPLNDFPVSAPIGRAYFFYRDNAIPSVTGGYAPTPAQV